MYSIFLMEWVLSLQADFLDRILVSLGTFCGCFVFVGEALFNWAHIFFIFYDIFKEVFYFGIGKQIVEVRFCIWKQRI